MTFRVYKKFFIYISKKFLYKIRTFLPHQIKSIVKYSLFISDLRRYFNLSKKSSPKLSPLSFYPILDEKTATTSFDPQYFYQGVWAFKRIKESKVKSHVDVGSEVRWVGLVSAITKVIFVDIRPFKTDLKDLLVKKGDILNLPFRDNSIHSLSCLHVAEHIGLGRYGDKLDPEGTKKACEELERILAVNGNLYFSVPVGKQRTHFNAHRIHPPRTIVEYFKDLKLIELSGVTDSGRFIENIDINVLEDSKYACGFFWLKKQES